MKRALVIIASVFLAASAVPAARVFIGDASFEGISTNVAEKTFLGVTIAGSANVTLGAWSASESSFAGGLYHREYDADGENRNPFQGFLAAHGGRKYLPR